MTLRQVATLLLVAGALVAQAPPGFKTYENKLAPLTFYYPTAYKEVPLPPTEQLLVAKFVMKKPVRELKKFDARLYKAAVPELHLFAFEDGVTPKTGAAEDGDTRGPSTVREAMEERSRVRSWKEFEAHLSQWNLREVDGEADVFEMQLKRGNPRVPLCGRLARKRIGNQIVGVYGVTWGPHEEKLQKIVERVIKSIEPTEVDDGDIDEERIDRIYRRGDMRGVERRKEIRRGLAKGWKAIDTENYLIVHHSKNRGLIQRIERDIEAMRVFFLELFPPAGEIDKVCVVRICETLEEYHQYGGRPGTGGYFHPGNEELVLFDYSYTQRTFTREQKERMGGKRLTSEDSMIVVYHEAFHQFIHAAIGEFSPHDWFNEGYGDYFSGAVVNRHTGRVTEIEPNSWRIHVAKDMCEFGEGWLPLRKILEAERAEFYNRARAGHYYAGAWSFVYFLRHSDEAKQHAKWSKILPDYFTNVKDCYQQELGEVDGEPDLRQKTMAGMKARKRALGRTLAGIDLDELEKVWRQWVIDMRDPWPGDRKRRKK